MSQLGYTGPMKQGVWWAGLLLADPMPTTTLGPEEAL